MYNTKYKINQKISILISYLGEKFNLKIFLDKNDYKFTYPIAVGGFSEHSDTFRIK